MGDTQHKSEAVTKVQQPLASKNSHGQTHGVTTQQSHKLTNIKDKMGADVKLKGNQ